MFSDKMSTKLEKYLVTRITIIRHPSPVDRVMPSPLHDFARGLDNPIPRGVDKEEQLGSQGITTSILLGEQLVKDGRKPDKILISEGYTRTWQPAEIIADITGMRHEHIIQTTDIDQGHSIEGLINKLQNDHAHDSDIVIIAHDSMPGQVLYRLIKGHDLGKEENIMDAVSDFQKSAFWSGFPESLDLSVPTNSGFTIEFEGSLKELLSSQVDLSNSQRLKITQVQPQKELLKPLRLARDVLQANPPSFSVKAERILGDLDKAIGLFENIQHEHDILPALYTQPPLMSEYGKMDTGRVPAIVSIIETDKLVREMHTHIDGGQHREAEKIREYVQSGGMQMIYRYADLEGVNLDGLQQQARSEKFALLKESTTSDRGFRIS